MWIERLALTAGLVGIAAPVAVWLALQAINWWDRRHGIVDQEWPTSHIDHRRF